MADKFNMEGGYFSPQGYMRIDAGGSHDENPNGGVQIGMDSQGIPNMLEEDESVYNDYVYSDNIRAGKKFLQQNHIPEKYTGKFYSEIADIFVGEAKDRPLDPISNNGLNAMLVRLASAQDAQKAEKEQRELEAELAKLSPEELDELEAMLSEQEAGTEPVQEEVASVPEDVQQPVQPVEQVAQPQMMAEGGLMRRLDDGTPGKIVVPETPPDTGTITPYYDTRTGVRKAIDRMIDNSSTLRSIQRGFRNFSESAPGRVLGALLPDFDSEYGMASAIIPAKGVNKVMDEAYRMLEAEKAYDAAYEAGKVAQEAAKGSKIKDAAKKVWGVGKYIFDPSAVWKSGWKPTTVGGKIVKGAVGTTQMLGSTALDLGIAGKAIETGVDQVQQRTGTNTSEAYEAARAGDPFANTRAFGGVINRYDNPFGTGLLDRGTGFGGTVTTEDVLKKHFPTPTLTVKPVNIAGLQEKIDALPGGNTIETPGLNIPLTGPLYDMPQTGFQPRNMELLGVPKLNIPPVGDNVATIRYKLRNGIPITPKPLNISLKPLPLPAAMIGTKPVAGTSTDTTNPEVPSDTTGDDTNKDKGTGTETGDKDKVTTTPAMLPTWPRYAGALASGILGVYNAFQRPDRYNIRHYNPEIPSARMHLIDPVYNPLDQNLLVNEALASGAGTVRALQNSGLGPSTGAALLAADYNLGRNIGDARAKVWDANNQRLNNVIAQRNGNAETLGNFDYMNSRDRAQIMNMAQLQNIQNDLMRQRLNYASEGEKYAALQSNIDSMSKSLAGIGNENFSMNQINNDSAYDYIALPGGGYAYMPKIKKDDTTNSSKDGGSLMRPYKKK